MSTQAKMGWIGYVKLGNYIVRATSCDIKTSQEITYPEVVDGRADTTLYQLGPKVTGGTVAFPLVHEDSSGACLTETQSIDTSNSLIAALWKNATQRGTDGRLNTFQTNVRYTDSLSYAYPGCMVNSMTITVTQSDAVQVSCDVWGGAKNTGDREPITPLDSYGDLQYLSPARTATWNDAIVVLAGVNGQAIFGQELREFTVMVNNNLERYYTLNGTLGVFDIAPKKREISGTIKIIGHNTNLTQYAYSNDARFTSDAQIGFGFKIGQSPTTVPYWATGLNGVIFEIEETSISTGLFETSTKYRATGRCDAAGAAYDATYLGTNVTPSSTAGAQYGSPTISAPIYTG